MAYTGRLAPSPTGLLHLGHAATFLAAAERAEQAGGSLWLRMDDLDPQRARPAFADAAREDLAWLGLHWQGEMLQSARALNYRAAVQELVARGLAYPCSCSRKDLQRAVEAPHEDTADEPLYPGHCRPPAALPPAAGLQTPDKLALPLNANLRFRVPAGASVCFRDGHYGPQRFTAGVDFGDFLVWRKDGLPSYQLACVVDDAALEVTEVVRGRDLLRSTARQILLQQALRLPTPAYFHTQLLHNGQGERLAKRHDALSLRALRNDGVTPADLRKRIAVLLASEVERSPL